MKKLTILILVCLVLSGFSIAQVQNTVIGRRGSSGGVTPDTITLDDLSDGNGNASQTTTVEHVVADQPNRILFVCTGSEDNDNPSDNVVTGVTFNGDSLTLVQEGSYYTSSRNYGSMWYMLAPDVGTHNVVATYAGVTINSSVAVLNFYNVNQAVIDDSDEDTGTRTTPNVTLTTAADNSWGVSCISGWSGTRDVASWDYSETERQNISNNLRLVTATYTDVIAGNNTTGCTWSTQSTDCEFISACFQPSES